MIGEMSPSQIDHLIKSQPYGRLCCGSPERLYVVPLSFVYEEPYLYGHSREGTKIRIMRSNKKVCFQVDQISNMGNWWSVMLWGDFEELNDPDLKNHARELIKDRLEPLVASQALEGPVIPGIVEKPTQPILFRIKVLEKSGRFEKTR